MSDSAETHQARSSSTSVVYRHVTLADGCELTVHPDRSVFIAMDEPPPIRTVVQLWRGDEARAVIVDRVIEVPDAEAGTERGFFGIPADEDAIAGATKVGTEHLEGPSGDESDGNDASARSDGNGEANINMAMPAPVVVHDDGEEADDAPDGDGSDDAPAVQAQTDGETTASSDDGGGNADDTAASSGRRKRGKGRGKRRR